MAHNALNRLEIERTFFNPVNGVPVLPGSGMKGAMRTALLDGMNEGRSLPAQERSLSLQQRLFRYDRFEQDPMRLVRLMDAGFTDEAGVGSELRFAVNRRRKAPKPGESSTQSQAEQRNLYQLLECVPAARFRVFVGQLTVQQVDHFKNDPRLPALPFRWNTWQIAAACNSYYRPQLEAEIQQMQERGYLDVRWVTLVEQLLKGSLGQRLDQNQAFLLRVGRHSGAESVTLNGVRSIKILLGKDGATGKMRSENRTSGTSWWLAADDTQARTGMLPFGWLLVELQPIQLDPPNGREVQEVLAELSTEYAGWIDRQREQRRQLAETVARQQAEEQVRQVAAATEATLSPAQKDLSELQRWFEEDQAAKRKEPGGRLANRLNELLKEGLLWPTAERETLATLAESIYSYLGGSGKKKQERKAKIQQLREKAT